MAPRYESPITRPGYAARKQQFIKEAKARADAIKRGEAGQVHSQSAGQVHTQSAGQVHTQSAGQVHDQIVGIAYKMAKDSENRGDVLQLAKDDDANSDRNRGAVEQLVGASLRMPSHDPTPRTPKARASSGMQRSPIQPSPDTDNGADSGRNRGAVEQLVGASLRMPSHDPTPRTQKARASSGMQRSPIQPSPDTDNGADSIMPLRPILRVKDEDTNSGRGAVLQLAGASLRTHSHGPTPRDPKDRASPDTDKDNGADSIMPLRPISPRPDTESVRDKDEDALSDMTSDGVSDNEISHFTSSKDGAKSASELVKELKREYGSDHSTIMDKVRFLVGRKELSAAYIDSVQGELTKEARMAARSRSPLFETIHAASLFVSGNPGLNGMKESDRNMLIATGKAIFQAAGAEPTVQVRAHAASVPASAPASGRDFVQVRVPAAAPGAAPAPVAAPTSAPGAAPAAAAGRGFVQVRAPAAAAPTSAPGATPAAAPTSAPTSESYDEPKPLVHLDDTENMWEISDSEEEED